MSTHIELTDSCFQPQKPRRTRSTAQVGFGLCTLIVAALVITWLCRLIIQELFTIPLNNAFWHRDFFGNCSVLLIIFALVRQVKPTLLIAAVTIIGFQLGNAGKLSVLGTPASPDDFLNIQNLFFLTEGWRRGTLILIALLPLILLSIFIPYRRVATWAVISVMLLIVTLAAHYSKPLQAALDVRFGNSVWNQPENFRQRGLALHLLQESIRTQAKVGAFPHRDSVHAAKDQLVNGSNSDAGKSKHSIPTSDSNLRNVHVIVLESFFDPLTLGPEWVPEDPFPQALRELWKASGNSVVLSPVFGGYTANAEFETLCGFPVTRNAVFFEGWLRRRVPCLPAVLAKAGYRSIASHPNVPGFWNRTHAYKLVGFDEYLSKDDFDLTDSVQGLLLDHSYYDQVFDKLEQKNLSQPVFNYMLTYHGHLPYPSSPQYPDKIRAGRESVLLHGYLNQLWYKSRDLMERIEKLKQEDPGALIVVFGDHLPFLGPNFGVYADVLGLPADRADFTGKMLEYLVTTPLIIIDGEKGPVNAGKLPLYRLPSLILSLLEIDNDDGILDWTKNPANSLIRPVYGIHIDVGTSRTLLCPDDDTAVEDCTQSAKWLERSRILISDLFSGKQYSLENHTTLSDRPD